MSSFAEAVNLPAGQPSIIQGPVGTQLAEAGYIDDSGYTLSIHHVLETSEGARAIADIHREYIARGADLVIAHTFGAQYGRNRSLAVAGDIQEANVIRAVRIAADVAEHEGRPVGASVSPFCDCYDPEKGVQLTYDQLVERQTRFVYLLRSGGAGFILAEAVPSRREAMAIAEATERVGLPYGISYFAGRDSQGKLRLPHDEHDRGSEPGMGPRLTTAARSLINRGYEVGYIATNCTPLEDAATTAVELKSTVGKKVLVGIWPNGDGKPDDTPAAQLEDRTEFKRAAFLPTMEECALVGAALIGGCCCTDFEDVVSLRKMVDDLRSEPRTA